MGKCKNIFSWYVVGVGSMHFYWPFLCNPGDMWPFSLGFSVGSYVKIVIIIIIGYSMVFEQALDEM